MFTGAGSPGPVSWGLLLVAVVVLGAREVNHAELLDGLAEKPPEFGVRGRGGGRGLLHSYFPLDGSLLGVRQCNRAVCVENLDRVSASHAPAVGRLLNGELTSARGNARVREDVQRGRLEFLNLGSV